MADTDLTIGNRVRTTDSKYEGVIKQIIPPHDPPRCTGDVGEVLLVTDTGKEVWTFCDSVTALF